MENSRTKSIVIIPPHILEQFASDSPKTYRDTNILVRWLYWGRLKRLVEAGHRTGDLNVLDYGCGGGVLLPTLSNRFHRVCGLDLNIVEAKRITELFDLSNVFIVRADGLWCPFADDHFDIVFAASVLEHFRDLKSSLREIRRILRPGGVLVSSSPTENWIYQVGRWVFRYKKPKAHCHSAEDISRSIRQLFIIQKSQYGPIDLQPLGVYEIIVARKQTPT